MAVGIDFGTTNSAVANADARGNVVIARFPFNNIALETFRSLLFFEPPAKNPHRPMSAHAGPDAIRQYLHSENGGRLIQSIKSYLADPMLRATNLFGRNYRLEELVAFLIKSLKTASERSGIAIGTKAVIGRPVRFVGSKGPKDDEYATERLREAFSIAGIHDVFFEFEPVAAAYSYEARMDHDEVLLVGDFGGGTTDFSVIQVGSKARKAKRAEERILANAGVGIAGDTFDAKLVRHLVAPLLGRGSQCRLIGKLGTMPYWPYAKLEHWHHLSFLKSKENMDALHALRAQAVEPEKIETLILLVSADLGFQLHNAVQRTKYELSSKAESQFAFRVPGIEITTSVTRQQFEDWISEELAAIDMCVENVIKQANLDFDRIDRVFLTGGSSFVPSVRRLFERRFGADKIASGSEFTSVANGLALRGLDLT